jgi:NTP pyrophosphatase (non-canonical NTP hydrolase)
MKETQETITKWADETFGASASNLRAAIRANQEMSELISSLASNPSSSKAQEEMADVLICLYRLASGLGVDIHVEVDRKMGVNRAREWVSDGTGCGQHVSK